MIFYYYFLLNFILFLILGKLKRRSKLYIYCARVSLAYDQLLNAILGGDEDETISSRAGKGRLRGSAGWTALANFLDWLDPNHSTEAIEWDEGTPQENVTLTSSNNIRRKD